MSSQRRQRASRANGSLSRGPVTPEGKKRSSQNAISHGLLAKCIILPGECEKTFEEVFVQHLERFAPADAVEEALVEEMAAAHWRMRRGWTIETTLLSDAIATQTGPTHPSRIATAFRQLASAPELGLLLRYETRLHMMYQRALHNILTLRDLVPPPDSPANTNPPAPVAPQPSGIAPTQTAPVAPVAPPDTATPLRPAAQLPDASPAATVPAKSMSIPPAAPCSAAIPNEPNPTSEHRGEAGNRRGLWWRKRNHAARRASLRAPILSSTNRAVTIP